MSKLTDKPAISEGTTPQRDHCSMKGAALLAARIVAYHAERGRRVECKVAPMPGPYGSALASKRMYGIRSDINPVRV